MTDRKPPVAWDRADAWLGLSSMTLIVLLAKFSSASGRAMHAVQVLTVFFFLIQPYLVARILRHVRPVARWVEWTLLTGALGGTAVSLVRGPKPLTFKVLLFGTVILSQLIASLLLRRAAARQRGLTAWRLNSASVGALLFSVLLILTTALTFKLPKGIADPLRTFVRYIPIWMLGAYYLGLTPPRWVRRLLQRGEEYRFVRRTSERPPPDRPESVAADLAEAAMRSVSAIDAVVLTGRRPLRVEGASNPSWIGREVEFSNQSPLARTLHTESPVSGEVGELEPALRDFSGESQQFVMVPVVATGRSWGVLCVVRRRSALFVSDDLDTLTRLCRHAADVLDHGQLLADERARQAREADARLDLILESLSDYAVIAVDRHGAVVSWNAGAEQVFGYPAAEIVGRSVRDLFDDGAPWLADELNRATAGTPMIADTLGRRRDGTTLTASIVIRPLQDRARAGHGFVIVMRDVSNQRMLEDRLRQAQKLEAIGRLAGGVAHDFNNMLTVILGYAAGLEQAEHPDERMAATEIRKAGERAAALTRQLLAFGRQQVLRPRQVAVGDVVKSMTPMLARLVGEHIEMVDIVESGVPQILADPSQLEQIVMNLVVNARDAMPEGGRLALRVAGVTLEGVNAEALTGTEGRHALLEVIDTGTGMDPDTQSRMFEPFFTTKEIGRGTGLGLAMVYGAVQQMHGAITVESKVGRGTAFRVYVPESR